MKTKILECTSLLVLISILIPSLLYSLPAEDVAVINNSDYFPKVHEIFQNAKKSIYVIMYSAYYYDNHPNSPSNILLKDLADARKRGLDVKVILEQGKPTSSGLFQKKKIQPQQHERVVQFLKQNKIPFILDSPNITTHAKLVIVDEIYIVIGSTNWSYSALAKNNETAVVIKSQEIAKSYTAYFNKILDTK